MSSIVRKFRTRPTVLLSADGFTAVTQAFPNWSVTMLEVLTNGSPTWRFLRPSWLLRLLIHLSLSSLLRLSDKTNLSLKLGSKRILVTISQLMHFSTSRSKEFMNTNASYLIYSGVSTDI